MTEGMFPKTFGGILDKFYKIHKKMFHRILYLWGFGCIFCSFIPLDFFPSILKIWSCLSQGESTGMRISKPYLLLKFYAVVLIFSMFLITLLLNFCHAIKAFFLRKCTLMPGFILQPNLVAGVCRKIFFCTRAIQLNNHYLPVSVSSTCCM